MVAPLNTSQLIDERSPFRNAITVVSVDGGSSINPLWRSEVSNDDFKKALQQFLKLNTMLADTNGKYNVTATLISLRQPLIGFDMTVDPTVRYIVTPAKGGTPLLDQTFYTPYTAALGDSLLGAERLRLANEGAIRNSITAFITALVAAKPSVNAALVLLTE